MLVALFSVFTFLAVCHRSYEQELAFKALQKNYNELSLKHKDLEAKATDPEVQSLHMKLEAVVIKEMSHLTKEASDEDFIKMDHLSKVFSEYYRLYIHHYKKAVFLCQNPKEIALFKERLAVLQAYKNRAKALKLL